jgi:hypothetical protein
MTAYLFTRSTVNLRAYIDAIANDPGAVGYAVLLRGVQAGRIDLVILTGHRDVWTPRRLPRAIRPTIVVISDDDDARESRGPAEWRAFLSASAWARTAVVHGAAARADHYEGLIVAAETAGRALLVETTSDLAPAWCATLAPRGIPTLCITPPAGTPHPVTARTRRSTVPVL